LKVVSKFTWPLGAHDVHMRLQTGVGVREREGGLTPLAASARVRERGKPRGEHGCPEASFNPSA
jgi:hypothetical protein